MNLGGDVPETDVRQRSGHRRHGISAFVHHRLDRRWARRSRRGVDQRAAFRCLYCHNPDTWTMNNGMPVSLERATEELRQYRHGLQVMSGGFTLSGGEPLMQHRFAA